MEVLHKFKNNDTLWRTEDTLVLEFSHNRRVISTSPLNGGIKDNIQAVFNQTCPPVTYSQELPGGGVKEYLALVATEQGFKPELTTGLLTAAAQKNAVFTLLNFRQLELLVVATAGVDINGGRPGDPAGYYEENGDFHPISGTINIFLSVNAIMPSATMVKAVITATEAKSGALLELLAPSAYSQELATGSGTDGIIIASDPKGKLTLTDSGYHSKLGELIGQGVRQVVQKALALETGLTPQRQMNILARFKRFGLHEEYLWEQFRQIYPFNLSKEEYLLILGDLARTPELVGLFSCLIHLVDQYRWGLLPKKAVVETGHKLLKAKNIHLEIDDLIYWLGHSLNEILFQKILANK